MAFFISYPLADLCHGISLRPNRLKRWYMNEGWQRVWYEKWHVIICLSYTSTEEITDLYQNVWSFLARIKYIVIEQEMYCFNMQMHSMRFFFFSIFNIIWKKIDRTLIIFCANIKENRCPPMFINTVSRNSRSVLTNIDGKTCNYIPEAVNKLALSARLGHSCETVWNKTWFLLLF